MEISLDHCVIHVSERARSNAFYRDVLGATLVGDADGPAMYRFGSQQLNVHGPGLEPDPVARLPVQPGGSDLCFAWGGTIDAAVDHLRAHGVDVELGPVRRAGEVVAAGGVRRAHAQFQAARRGQLPHRDAAARGRSLLSRREFREVDPPYRLTYTFVWEDPDPDDVETLVELSFRDLGESTEPVFTQAPFKTEARRELHRNGWTESLDKLELVISQT